MKFKGKPNLVVKVARTVPPLYFRFDENGFYETENAKLIARLKPHFEVVNDDKNEVKDNKNAVNLVKNTKNNKINPVKTVKKEKANDIQRVQKTNPSKAR